MKALEYIDVYVILRLAKEYMVILGNNVRFVGGSLPSSAPANATMLQRIPGK
jgi:hypothetical protein